MSDVFTRKQRSRVMASVKSKNTTPEIQLRSLLHRSGYRFRLHRSDLPGKPDIVLPRYKVVVFVHGCFWHQHMNCDAAQRPASNSYYWNRKLDRNVQRDRRNRRLLKKKGWEPIVVWECQLKDPEKVRIRLKRMLNDGKTR